MSDPRFKMKKIWTDEDFFEVNVELIGNECSINLNIYLDNEALETLQRDLTIFSRELGKKEFTWLSGSKTENTSHFLSMKFFLHEKRVIVGIEVNVDNKLERPNAMHSNFFLIVEFGQIDDLARKLQGFIKEEVIEIESLFGNP